MFRQKLLSTAMWAGAVVAAAMIADYVISILILDNPAGYTPFVTLAIAVLVAFPVSYGLISGSYDLRRTRDELAAARDAAEDARSVAQAALREAENARHRADVERFAAVEANRAKSEFLANMSHELRTPLNAILGFAQMLALDGFADKRVEYAELIRRSGSHLLGLVDDLLDLSRIEAKKLAMRDEDIDIEALCRDCLTLVEPQASQAGIVLARSVEPLLPPVLADRRALKQMLLNLLANAVKFTGEGKTVEIFARRDADGGMTLGVRDEGAGIAAEDLPRMFERFGQGRHDVSHRLKGTGLGLPIVKGLAEAHGGRVSLTSELGTGTCVTIRLPPERLRSRSGIAAA